nr:efflux RND transporter periplasmic adaptor subunit [Chitinophagaceae bacterium]
FDGDLQAQLRKLEVQLKVAEATERRQKELLAINGTSQQDYDLAGLNVSNIKADMELLRVNIAKTELRAPFDGRLGLRSISLGAYVTPATIVTSIAEVSRVKIEFAVPEKYAADMQPGKNVALLATATGRRYNAVVVAAENSIAAASRNLMVRAAVSNKDASLTPGAFVEVTMEMGNKAPAIMIPSQALLPGTRNKNVIVSNGGKAAFRIVTTGYRDSARIEITSGLKVGDTVITTGLLTIKDGMPIKPKVKL